MGYSTKVRPGGLAVAHVTSTAPRTPAWTAAPANISSIEAAALLREYLIDVLDRSLHLHLGRPSTTREIELALVAHPSGDLALPPPAEDRTRQREPEAPHRVPSPPLDTSVPTTSSPHKASQRPYSTTLTRPTAS